MAAELVKLEKIIFFALFDDSANIGIGRRDTGALELAANFAADAGLFFRENAAAIFLHIEANATRFVLTFAPAFAEIAVDKFDAVFGSELGHIVRNEIMALVNTIKQRGRNSVVAMRFGIVKSMAQTERIAIFFATRREFVCDIATKFIKAVNVVKLKLNIDELGIFFETVAARLVLGVRVNVGVVPVERRFNSFSAESFDAINTAGRATSVE